MTQESSPNGKSGKTGNPGILLKGGVSLLSGLSILSSGLIWTQATATTSDLVIPETTAPSTSPPKMPTDPAAAPVNAAAGNPTPVREFAPPAPKVRLSAPKISVPSSGSAQISPRLTEPSLQTTPNPIESSAIAAPPQTHNYIDTTNYNPSESAGYVPPTSVILTDRATGCKTISQNGRLSSGICRTGLKQQPAAIATRQFVTSPPASVAARPSARRSAIALQPIRLKILRPQLTDAQSSPASWALASIAQYNRANNTYLSLEPVPQYNRATVMGSQAPLEPRRTSLIFPLPIPATLTSAFGWRMHPITGTARMHSGTDIGAPMGTPVLAAYRGEVAAADWSGGYGLMVILRHEGGTQESRYAHLSEIYVRPGDWVEQGVVIGRVGSTGLSTGPHLHFEWRHLTQEGWVAVDAGLHLEYALENLIQSLQMAGTAAQPNGES